MRLSLPEYNIVLIDFQDIHKKYEKDLLDDIHKYQLMDSLVESQFSNKDVKKLLFHHTIKNCVEYINKVNYYQVHQIVNSPLISWVGSKVPSTPLTVSTPKSSSSKIQIDSSSFELSTSDTVNSKL